MESDVKRWLESDGRMFLRKLGLKKGQTILDFGCGDGHYTIPAAKAVGKEGKVYAVDNDKEVLNVLGRMAEKEELKNIELVKIKIQLKIPEMDDNFIDLVLLYDVIHLVSDRNRLYKEIYRIIRPKGLLSIYPKHYKADDAGWGLKDMTLDNIIEEIGEAKFHFEGKSFRKLMHDDYYDKGYILNFRK